MYLLDTDVLSLTSPLSKLKDWQADMWRAWVRDNEANLYFSVVTLMEVRFGLEQLTARGATAKADSLRRWLVLVETIYASRILPVTPDVAHTAGAFLHAATAAGVKPSSEDAMIAATAERHRFQLVSRNIRHMGAFGLDVIDPLNALP